MIRFAVVRACALFAALEASKLLVCALRAADGCSMHWSRVAAAGVEEVIVAAAALCVLLVGGVGAARLGLGSVARRCSVVLTVAVGSWAALNVPVARLIGTPLTWPMLSTASGTVGDSVSRYVTASNVGAMAAVMVVACVAAPLLRALPRAGLAVVGAVAGVVMLAAALRSGHDPVALDRDPVLTLARSLVAPRRVVPSFADEVAAEDDATTRGLDLTALAGAARGRHVVWVVLESTGARYLSTYGSRHDPMPNLAALAHQGIVWEHAHAVQPDSIKGLYSMLCSFAPAPRTDARDYAADRLPCASLPEVMTGAGYRAGLWHSGRFEYLGMDRIVRDRSFEVLADARVIGGKHASSFGTDDLSTANAVLARFDRRAPGERVLAMYMPISGHHPYESPGEGPRPFGEATEEDRYRSDLYRGDLALGALVKGLQARGVWEDTLLVVHGDHGEAFFQHEGNFAHTLFPYDENLHVPLVVVAPGLVAKELRARQLVSLLDVAPTIAALTGVPVEARWQGRSALEPSPRVVRGFTDQVGERVSLRTGRFKLLQDRDAARTLLFDLAVDPDERVDVARAHPERVERYTRDLGAWTAAQAMRVEGGHAQR